MSEAGRRARRIDERIRMERGLSEMMGLVRGIIADGLVSSDEAERLARWTRENPDVASRWPANLLARRLERVFADGRLDAHERRHLEAVLAQMAENPAGLGDGFTLATDLPLTHPEPEVVIRGATFVFAGEMAFGPRRACERETEELGGRCERAVSRRTDYLVIGSLAAADWSQAEFGPLVDDAVRLRGRGAPIHIVREARWAEAL